MTVGGKQRGKGEEAQRREEGGGCWGHSIRAMTEEEERQQGERRRGGWGWGGGRSMKEEGWVMIGIILALPYSPRHVSNT